MTGDRGRTTAAAAKSLSLLHSASSSGGELSPLLVVVVDVAAIHALVSHGGVVLDGLVFSSEAQVKEVVMKECPMGDAFEVFLVALNLLEKGARLRS